ncbi:hypothetical protein BG000_009262 [Podila horticola]|nr:hypothetical protein BG000_009262 [Podila horticola]
MATARTHKKARYDTQYTPDSNSPRDAAPLQPILTHTSLLLPSGAALVRKDPMSYFPEEIATHIFEALNPADLGKCATVSKLWHRLVNDQILWQQLFIKYGFISPRGLNLTPGHLPSSSHGQSHNNNNILSRKRKRTAVPQRQLQQRQYQLTSQNQCWKALYRLNYNWTMGQATVSTLSLNDLWLHDQDVLLQSLTNLTRGSPSIEELQDTIPRITVTEDGSSRIVRFKGQVILVASPQGMVHLWRIRAEPGLDTSAQERKPEYWQTYTCPRIPDGGGAELPRISCLALDTSNDRGVAQEWQRVMVGYESGHFSIFQYYQGQQPLVEGSSAIVEVGATTQLVAWSEVGAVHSACFRYPVVATSSQEDGAISIYRIQGREGGANAEDPQHWCRLLHRLYGTPTQSPVEMELSHISSAGPDLPGTGSRLGVWRILAGFGLELFDDNSWTVRVQEIEFDELSILLSKETGAEGESTSSTLDPAVFQEQDSSSFGSVCPEAVVDHPRIGAISALSISWPYVVTTHSDNTLNVFRMHRAAGRGGQDKGTKVRTRLVLQHISTLYGHCGAVSSVSIEPGSGRLVSASMDRSIKIWTLSSTPPRRSGEHMKRHGSSSSNHRHYRQQRQYQCSVSMSDINKSWTKAGQVTKEEGQGLLWVGADEEKVMSVSCDGSIKVWQFS